MHGTSDSAASTVTTLSPTRLGDTLFCTPAYRHIKQVRPDLQLTVIALSATAADVLAGNPNIDQLLLMPSRASIPSIQTTQVIHLHHLAAAEPYLEMFAVTPQRIGPQNDAMHCAEQTVRFVTDIFGGTPDGAGYDLPFTSDDLARVSTYLPGDDGSVLIGIHLGCHGLHKSHRSFWRRRSHAKAWPLARYIQLAQALQREHPDIRFVLTGSGAEAVMARRFAKRVEGTVNLVGSTTVRDLRALMERLALFICGDTGPIHVACASDVPTLGLYGPTELHRTGPYPPAPHRRILLEPDLHQLSVDRVTETALVMLE